MELNLFFGDSSRRAKGMIGHRAGVQLYTVGQARARDALI
jgi:hypothetical protein